MRRRGPIERFLLSIMGPAQIGENKAPDDYVIDEAANFCPKCHLTWAAHVRVHTGSITYRRCPG